MVFDPIFNNRDESGIETNIDGFQTPWDSDMGAHDTSRAKVYTTSEVLEHEEIIDDQI